MSEPFRTRSFVAVEPHRRPVRQRAAVRVIVTDGSSVLLLSDTDPGAPGTRWWVTPGGGIDPHIRADQHIFEAFQHRIIKDAARLVCRGAKEAADKTGFCLGAGDLSGGSGGSAILYQRIQRACDLVRGPEHPVFQLLEK